MNSKKPFDFLIFLTVLILLSIGTIMVFSSSAPHAYNYMQGDTYYFLKKQLTYAPVGLLAMIVTMNIDYRKLGKWSPVFLIGSIVLLVLVLVPGIGAEFNGSRRWIRIGTQPLQPSEIAKLSLILFFAHSLSRKKDGIKSFFKGLLPYLIIIGIFGFLLLKEPHMSVTMVICMVCSIILFCAGAKIKHFLILGVPAVAGAVVLMLASDYRRDRVMSFLNPWADMQGGGWQIVQSLYAIGSGGLFGRGLGKSLQKFLYIPEPYNDFILAVLAEELGFIGVLTVLLLFLIFIWRGVKVSMNAPDVFGSLVAIGITSLIAVQVILNVAVVTSSMPVTGVPLPFLSYGGTSLVFLMSGVGILLNISRYSNYERI
ncbi:MAG: stage V sporulation protein E [Clostridiaceae bacterium]|nr:stage V sporulation protein E [Clostridiaceae bacterium]